MPDVIPSYSVAAGTKLIDALVEHALATSKTDVRRLVENGAVTDLDTNEKIGDAMLAIETTLTLKIGKHRFARLQVKSA